MTKPNSHFLASAHSLKLTERERDDARELLQFRMQFPHSFAALSAAGSAFVLSPDEKMLTRVQLVENMQSVPHRNLFRFSFWRGISTITACFGIVVMSGGVLAYAAESAIPGDLLYPVKISVNEPVIESFQRTSEQKAEWAAKRLERRFAEARVLVMNASVRQEQRVEQRGEEVNVNTATRVNRSESASAAADASAPMPTVTSKSALQVAVPKPAVSDDRTQDQEKTLEELKNAGVSEGKIVLWMHALRGKEKHSSSAVSVENGRGENRSASSLHSESSRSSVSTNKKKKIIEKILEQGTIVRSASSESRKGKHSSSPDSSDALLSSDGDSSASSLLSSSSNSSSSSSLSTRSSSASVSSASSSSVATSSLTTTVPVLPAPVPPVIVPPASSVPAVGDSLGL